MMDSEEIRWYPDATAPVRLQIFRMVIWEMHGLRGVLTEYRGKPLPYASKFVLDCGQCRVRDVAAGCHSFDISTCVYVTSLARVWNDREEWPGGAD